MPIRRSTGRPVVASVLETLGRSGTSVNGGWATGRSHGRGDAGDCRTVEHSFDGPVGYAENPGRFDQSAPSRISRMSWSRHVSGAASVMSP